MHGGRFLAAISEAANCGAPKSLAVRNRRLVQSLVAVSATWSFYAADRMLAAVKDESGHYHLNGHLVSENGRSEIIRQIAGSQFKYEIRDDDQDYLFSLGPLRETLIIEVCLYVIII